jgi:NADH:ubiquinone oxidoreductase subunit H
LLFFVIIEVWILVPVVFNHSTFIFSSLLFLLILGIIVYNVVLVGVVSVSKYGFLGGIRAGCQAIRYEIRFSFQLFILLNLIKQLTLFRVRGLCSLLILIIWWISCICECNRAPFDFSEGERELIRGFNIEYSRVGFIYIFLGEYGIILVLSIMRSCLFFNSSFFIFSVFFYLFIVETS